MQYFYRNVPRLGNVAVTRHAQDRLRQEKISAEFFKKALLEPTKPDMPDGQDVLFREREGVRLVILLKPTPDRGVKLVKTVYRVQEQARVRR